MSAFRLWCCFATTVALASAAGDGPSRAARWEPRPAAGSARPEAASRADPGGSARPAIPPFTLFGWVSPPIEQTTAERIAELAGAGLNVMLPAWDDAGRLADTRVRTSLAAAHGVRCLAWDRRLDRVDFEDPSTLTAIDSVVADYRDDPGFLGYYFTDEPQPPEFPRLAAFYSALRARDPVHPAFDNLLGRSAFGSRTEWERYARAFIERVRPAVLCDDQYDFLVGSDDGLFVENAVGLRSLADEYGIPFWSIVLLVQHGRFRGLTPGELRWQVSMLLAYGARGVGYFTYWTPAPDPVWNWQPAVIGWDGTRSPWYDVLAGFNPSVRAAGETLAGLRWLSTGHAGSLPRGAAPFAPDEWIAAVEGRAALGRFGEASDMRYVLVANADSLSGRTITLALARPAQAWRLGNAREAWTALPVESTPQGARVALDLQAGGFALLRLDAVPGAATPGPSLAAAPNPARGEVRLTATRTAMPARLEILDASGRIVWARAVAPGAPPLDWRGERDGGGVAPAGLYFARIRDARGTATVRVSWLGRP
jgi:hypothetical protein